MADFKNSIRLGIELEKASDIQGKLDGIIKGLNNTKINLDINIKNSNVAKQLETLTNLANTFKKSLGDNISLENIDKVINRTVVSMEKLNGELLKTSVKNLDDIITVTKNVATNIGEITKQTTKFQNLNGELKQIGETISTVTKDTQKFNSSMKDIENAQKTLNGLKFNGIVDTNAINKLKTDLNTIYEESNKENGIKFTDTELTNYLNKVKELENEEKNLKDIQDKNNKEIEAQYKLQQQDLKELQKLEQQRLKEETDLINQMANAREKSQVNTQTRNNADKINQANAINKALEDNYKQQQKQAQDDIKLANEIQDAWDKAYVNRIASEQKALSQIESNEKKAYDSELLRLGEKAIAEQKAEQELINQMANGREKSQLKSQQSDRSQELAQAKAINKNLEEEYKLQQENEMLLKHQAEFYKQIEVFKSNGILNKSDIDGLEKMVQNATKLSQMHNLFGDFQMATMKESSITSLSKQLEDAQIKLNKMKQSFGTKLPSGFVESIESEINKLKTDLTKVDGMNFNGIKNSLNQLNTEMKVVNNETQQLIKTSNGGFFNGISNFLGKIGVFYGVQQVVQEISQQLRNASEYVITMDTHMSNIQMITGKTKEQVSGITNSLKDLASGLHTTNTEMMAGAEEMLRAGYSDKDTEKLMQSAIIGSKVSGQTVDEVSQQLITLKNSFDMSADEMEHVIDIFSKMDNTSATSFKEIASAIQRTAYSAQEAGVPLETLTAYITTTSEKTRRSAETIGESYKTIFSRYQNIKLGNLDEDGKSINDTETALSRIGISIRDNKGEFRDFNSVLQEFMQKIQEGSISQVDMLAGVQALAGTRQKESLLALITNMDDLKKHQEDMTTAGGSAKKMFDEVYGESLDAKIQDLKRAFEELYEKILTSDALKWLITEATELVNALSNVDSSTIKIIATFTTLGLALKSIATFTTALKSVETIASLGKDAGALGNLAKGFTSLGTSIKGVATASLSFIATPLGASLTALSLIIGGSIATYETYQELISKPLDTPTEELSEFEQTINSFTGGIYKSKKELQDAGLVYEDFGDDISDSFKDGVEKATDTFHEFEMALTKSNIDDTTSNENAKAIKGMVNNIVDEAKSTIMSRKSEVQNEMSKLFTAGDGKVDSSEQNILDYLGQGYNEKFDTIQEINQKIYDTWNKAIQDHGKLSEEDIALIKKYVQQVQQIEMEAKANNESEQNFAKNQFIERLSGISAKDATEVYQKAKKDLDESNADARASYDTGLQDLKKYHDQLLQEKEQALKDGDTEKAKLKQSIADETQIQIDAKEDEYQKLIQKQRLLQKDYLEELYKKNPNLKGKINEIDGSEFNKEDINSQENVRKVTEQFDEIANATETGIKHVQDKAGNWHDVFVTIDKNTGLITSTYDSFTNETGGYTKEFEDQANDFATKYKDGLKRIQDALTGTHMGFGRIDGSNQLLDNAGNILTTLENVKTQADGTKEAIISLNGQEIVIKTDADGTITNLDEIYTKLGLLPEGKTIKINAETGAVEIVDKVEEKVDEVDGKTGTVKVDANTSQANSKVDETSEKVDELDGQTANPTVQLQTGNSLSLLDRIKSGLSWLSGKVFNTTVNVTRTEQDTFDENRTQLNADGSVGHNAKGTNNWRGGLTYINENEEGELVDLPSGTRIIPHDLSEKIIEEEAKNSNTGNITINKIDIYQGKENETGTYSINKTNTLDSPYVPEVDTSKMSESEKKAYDEKKKAEDEEEKKLKDRVDKEKQYLDDVGSYWDTNSKSVQQSIKELELKEDEYGKNITVSQKMDILNQKYQRELDLLPEAEKQLNTYKNTTVTTQEAQEELSKKIQDANDTLIDQKKAVIDAYNEIEEYREEIRKANEETLLSIRDELAQDYLKEAQDEVDKLKKKAQKAYEEARESLEEEKQAKLDTWDEKIKQKQAELDILNDESKNNEETLKKLQTELAYLKKDNSTEAQGKISDLNEQISDLELTIKKDNLQKQIDNLNTKKQTASDYYDDELADLEESNKKKEEKAEEYYEDLLSEEKAYNKANKKLKNKNFEDIEDTIEKHSEKWKSLGAILGDKFDEGLSITDRLKKVSDAIDNLKDIDVDIEEDSSTKASGNSTSKTKVYDNGDYIDSNGYYYTSSTPSSSSKTSSSSSSSKSSSKSSSSSSSNSGWSSPSSNGYSYKSETVAGVGKVTYAKKATYETGGRTPSDIGADGKEAILHADEKILNKEDTIKFDNAIDKINKIDTIEIDKIYDLIKSQGSMLDTLNSYAMSGYYNSQAILPTLDLNRLANSVVNNTNTDNSNVEINNTYNVDATSDFNTKNFSNNLDKQLKNTLRRFGKIK